MANVTGNIRDITSSPIVGKGLVVEFVLCTRHGDGQPAQYGDVTLDGSPKAAALDPASGAISIDVASNDRTHPDSWYRIRIRQRFLDQSIGYPVERYVPGRLVVPPQGGKIKDLLTVKPNSKAVFKGSTRPDVPSDWRFTYNPDTGIFREWDEVMQDHVFLADLRGTRGERGKQGIPGLNAEATDAGVAAYLLGDDTASGAAARELIRELTGVDPNLYSYNLNEQTMGIIRHQLRGRAARISVHGASSGQGAGSGTRYIYDSWPGRVGALMQSRFGQAGPGMMIPWSNLFPNPAANNQPNLVMGGTLEARPLGIYQLGGVRVTRTGNSSYIGVDDVFCDYFRVILATTSGLGEAIVDGVSVGTIKLRPDAAGNTLPYQTGYAYDPATGAGQVVSAVPAGNLGFHGLRLRPVDEGNTMTVLSIEPWVTKKPTVVVNNLALSGIASGRAASTESDDTNGYSGMSVSVDASRAHLHVIQVGTNDYQAHVAIATYKENIRRLIRRAKTSIPVANGGTTLAASVLLVAGQPVNEREVPAADSGRLPAFSEYSAALYELADEENVALLDLNLLFGSFDEKNAAGWYADNLHPTSLGHEMIARAVDRAIMAGV